MKILSALEGPGGGGGGGNNDWKSSLPEDLKSEPMLKDIPDVATLTKNYVHAQRFIGQKRLLQPEEGWTKQQWDEFYSKVGRPETPDKYQLPKVELKHQLPIDDKLLVGVQAKAHELGLTDRQFKGMMELYLRSMDQAVEANSVQRLNAKSAAEAELKKEWGEKYSANLNLAKNVVMKFGTDEELLQFVEESGLGNDPRFIKFLHNIGSAMLEDTMRGGEAGGSLQITDRQRALQEIESLKGNKEFMDAWSDPRNPGHAGAVQQWLRLHQVAYSGKTA